MADYLLKAASTDARAAACTSERGRSILRAVADAYRAVAEIYALDPTLKGCPARRERDLDLVVELCRQIPVLVRRAVEGRDADRWPIDDRWAEAEAMAGRLPEILDRARAVARPDHATPAGSQAISRTWLVAASDRVAAAGEDLHDALAKARSLPHPAQEIAELSALADQIIQRAAALDGTREGS
ncbi:hypothetical protein [Spongiactinospora sp. TRM90649]|uniref:hypothetical protein n=1 Tax=Spongiactinospora sp. TRM90649 TaxID=3031114 RepID=UPI0023F708A2|nr:hypothetical protein [Spongiactinospora sp. TRM90649]MDF5758591.1 hypothetical protein [Spongiactinospora sp. TRM90649]